MLEAQQTSKCDPGWCVHKSDVQKDMYVCMYVCMYVYAPVAQRYHVTSDTLGREFDPGKRDFSH